MIRRVIILLFLCSCTLYDPMTINFSYDDSEVVLSDHNYIVVAHVADTINVFRLISMSSRQERYLRAKSLENLNKKADMIGRPKALISVNTYIKRSFSPFFRKYQIITSADVIEFTESSYNERR